MKKLEVSTTEAAAGSPTTHRVITKSLSTGRTLANGIAALLKPPLKTPISISGDRSEGTGGLKDFQPLENSAKIVHEAIARNQGLVPRPQTSAAGTRPEVDFERLTLF